ncbi:MAG: dihydroorotase [Aerococcus sp.]|nr:dihydroorotase [Aerococcus sp.]
MRTLITRGEVYYAHHLQPLDIVIEDTEIVAVGTSLRGAMPYDRVIDASGCLVTPGLIDMHVHYREPGQTAKETVETGAKAAAHGGFTTVGVMPNTTPVPDMPERVQAMVARNTRRGIHIRQYATLTHGLHSEELVDFKALKDAGAFAFSNDGAGVQTAGTMYDAMQAISELDMVLAAHIQDDSLSRGGVMTAGDKADALGLPGQLPESETAQLARDLVLAKATGCRYHACHISTRESLELIRYAKAHGIPVTCEVSPHHLILSTDHITSDDPMLKMNPPLRSEDDRLAMIEGLLDRTIDMIATDHAPHTKADKGGSMANGAFGIIGSDFAFSLLYTHLVKPGLVPLETILECLTAGPADAFNLGKVGRIAPGYQADLAIFDLNDEWTISEDTLASKASNTPHLGEMVSGVTRWTMADGKLVYSYARGVNQ